MNKKSLSEDDICAKLITPAVLAAGWDEATQIRRQIYFTKGRIIVRGKLVTRGKAKRADYVLYWQHFPIALIEAKDNNHGPGDGMQQALDYATTLDVPFVFSSNGDAFVFHDRTGVGADRKLTHRGCGQKLGLPGGSSCIHTKRGFERSSSTSSSANASGQPSVSWVTQPRMP